MRVLIIGSLGGELGRAARLAVERGARVDHAESVAAALHRLRADARHDLVLCDVSHDVGQLVRALVSERLAIAVVACGCDVAADIAAASIRAGAREFLPLPADPELIAAILVAASGEPHAPVVRDPLMLATMRRAEQVAASEASILITGESGTGKEVLARYIHRKSRRAHGPFVALDVRLQAKLLRAIQEREIDRLGGASSVSVNVRILATSNRDLPEEIARGRFREDLYFRLNVVGLTLPPLRDRPGDIAALAEHYARHYAGVNGLPQRPLTQSVLTRLASLPWRGNVRELENTVHRAVLLARGDSIDLEAIELPTNGPAAPAPAPAPGGMAQLVGRRMEEVERDLILHTLTHTLGNRTHAATILGISIRALRNKLRDYAQAGAAVPPPQAGLAA